MDRDKKIYAHSLKGQPPEKWQPLEEHLANVAKTAAKFANEFNSAAWAYNAGILHDLGKALPAFQSYLRRQNGLENPNYDSGNHNHSSAGAAFAIQKFGECVGKFYAYAVAGHHAGLPDWYTSDTANAALSARLPEGRDNLERIQDYSSKISGKLISAIPPEFARRPENVHLWIRMLYSCLVDADFLDTEAFMDTQKSAQRATAKFATLPQLKEKLDAHLAALADSAPKTPVNAIRREILNTCRSAAEFAPGLFSLTVPTGGGKTLSGMAFALDHAIKHGRSRIIYVIPYTSIIEQTADIFRRIFGQDQVLEHHSNIEAKNKSPEMDLAAENWDAPIIVTTNVQFFESLYAAKSSRCRKLHSIVNSVIILDEAQLLPPGLLAPCVDAMNQLVQIYNVTMVLATATQPALSTLPGPCPRLAQAREIIPPELLLYERLKRTECHFPADLNTAGNWPELAARLQQHEQVLCVVNTRRDCYDLFKLMPEGTIHLSALMCGEHRSKIIAEIKRRLDADEACRVISTQIVEAGADIDFPVVYRALAGLDSIAQAAGRCNREGRLNERGTLGQVHVFIPPKPAPPGILGKGEGTTKELASLANFAPDAPAEFTRYFNLFYSKVNDHGAASFKEWLSKDVNPAVNIQFRTAAANFKLIDDSCTRPVIVRYGDSDKWIAQIRAIGPKRDTMRKLQRYTVNLPVRMVEKMKNDGMLEEVHDGIMAQTMPNLYAQETGLDIFRDSLPIEDITCI